MPFFQDSSDVEIHNSTFNEIHGNLINIRFGEGPFTEIQKKQISDHIANRAMLPDIDGKLKKHILTQTIVNLPRPQAAYNDYQTKKKTSPCFKGTREALLQEMANWVITPNQSSIYVLSGLAGIGKSTIAYTIAARADELGLLGASFFFSRDEADRRTAQKFFTTLAFQLSVYEKCFADAIGAALLTERGSAATTKDPLDQLQALILEPLQSIVSSRPHPILIVVDALDECDDNDGRSVLLALNRLVRDLPSFKVILTMRPQPRLDYTLRNQGGHKISHLQEIETKVVDGDIRVFLTHGLSQKEVRTHLGNHEEHWGASNTDIDSLVDAAGHLFIIASTSVRFILDNFVSDPAARMAKLLIAFAKGRTPFNDLNHFYTVILREAISVDCDDPDLVERYKAVVGAIVLIQTPLPIMALASLIDRRDREIYAVLRNLQSIILLGSDNTPRIYHKSFPDYVTDPARCKDQNLRIEPGIQHTLLAICCLKTMNGRLKYNILGLGDPARFMDNKDGLATQGISDSQIEEKIPLELQYACVYWAHHLRYCNADNTDLVEEFARFANERLLYWFETLSWMDKLDSAHGTLSTVLSIQNFRFSDLQQLLSDGLRFVTRFYPIIKRSALHTYYSALPFTPTESRLYQQYHKEMMHNLCQVQGGPEKWSALLAAPIHGERVCQELGFSPDNIMFYSQCDEQLNVWNAATSTPIHQILGSDFAIANDFSTVASVTDTTTITLYNVGGNVPLTSFQTSTAILAVALSSDGSRVAAGLSDGTVSLWDSVGRELITSLDDFKSVWDDEGGSDESDEYSGLDNSSNDSESTEGTRDNGDSTDDDEDGEDEFYARTLAFSPSGTRLAYFSLDGGVKLCDGISGKFISNLTRQSEIRDHFLYSSDGSRIASLSNRSTLTLWSSEDGKLIGFVTNAGDILAISADGSLLAAAFDVNVKLWRTDNGNLLKFAVVPELQDEIITLAFSRDNILAIGVLDSIILYDTKSQSITSKLVMLEPQMLAFSPDGTRLVAGNDGAVYLWDISNIAGSNPIPSNDDGNGVNRLTFSQDGSRLASALYDDRIEFWETEPTKRLIAVHKSYPNWYQRFIFNLGGTFCVAESAAESIKQWKSKDSGLIEALESGLLGDDLEEVALSSTVLAAATDDGIALWDLQTQRQIGNLNERGSMGLSFSAHGDLLASFSPPSTVTVYDVSKHRQIISFEVKEVHKMTFLPDDSQLVVQSLNGDFQSFNLTDKKVTQRPKVELLNQLRDIPCYHGIPVWLCMGGLEDYVGGLFPQHENHVPVLWIPTDVGVTCFAQGPLMALGCNDGRVIFVKPSNP